MRKNGVVAAVVVALVVIAVGVYYFMSGGGGGGGVSTDRLRQVVDQLIKKLPPGITASYKSIDGGTIKGVALHWKYDQGSGDYTVDEIDLSNPNLDLDKAWDAAMADPKKLTPDTVIPLYDGATMKGVAVQMSAKEHAAEFAVNGSLASLTSKGARLYPWALAQPGVPSLTEIQAFLAAGPPTQPSLQAFMPLIRFFAAVSLTLGSDGTSMENMKYTMKFPTMPGTDMPHDGSYEVKKMIGDGMDRGVVKGLTAEGLSAKMGSQGGMSVERISYGGYDLRKALTKVLAAQTLTPDMLDGIKVGKIEYTGMAIQTPTSTTPIQLASFSISDIAFSGPVPVSAGFSLQGLKISKEQMPDPQSKMGFEQLGLDTMTISMGAAYEWDLAKKSIKVHDVVLKVEELGAVTLGADVVEITPDLAGAMGAQLVHAQLRYADASLVDRAFKAAAKMQGQDPAQFRQQMTGMVQVMSAQFANSPPLAAAAKAVMDFLNAPKSLTIELSPPKPLPIMQLSMLAGGGAQPAQIATMVGLAVTANK